MKDSAEQVIDRMNRRVKSGAPEEEAVWQAGLETFVLGYQRYIPDYVGQIMPIVIAEISMI